MNNTEDQDDQDPDYAVPGPSNGIQQQIFEETGEILLPKKNNFPFKKSAHCFFFVP